MEKTLEAKLQEIDRLKKKLTALKPFDEELLGYLCKYLDTELTYNSNAIEGSTMSFNETKFILNDGYVNAGKNVREVLEVVNHRDAIRYIEDLAKYKAPYIVSEEEILALHKEILKGIDYQLAGVYRNSAVYIRKTNGEIQQFPDWQEVPEQVRALLQWLRENEKNYHPVILAAELHYRFVSIHPFKDGNGRTSRLLMNLILLQNGFPMANIKMATRSAYFAAIDCARIKNDLTPFYLITIEALKEILDIFVETFEKRIIWK